MSALCAHHYSLCVGTIKLGGCAKKDMLQQLHATPLPITLARLQKAEGSIVGALWHLLLLRAALLYTSSDRYLHSYHQLVASLYTDYDHVYRLVKVWLQPR